MCLYAVPLDSPDFISFSKIIGYCACPFKDVEVETCSEQSSALVTPDPTATCSVMMRSTTILSTSNAYVNWKDLAVTSCAVLDPAKTYCYKIESTGSVQRSHSASAVVGFEMLATGRRRRRSRHLLGFEEEDTEEEDRMVHYMLYNASWDADAAGEVCRDLVHDYRVTGGESRSVMDRHFLKQCLHWRFITNQTLQKFNLTAAPNDVFMLSWNGFIKVTRILQKTFLFRPLTRQISHPQHECGPKLIWPSFLPFQLLFSHFVPTSAFQHTVYQYL
jgi:hypothetical protein